MNFQSIIVNTDTEPKKLKQTNDPINETTKTTTEINESDEKAEEVKFDKFEQETFQKPSPTTSKIKSNRKKSSDAQNKKTEQTKTEKRSENSSSTKVSKKRSEKEAVKSIPSNSDQQKSKEEHKDEIKEKKSKARISVSKERVNKNSVKRHSTSYRPESSSREREKLLNKSTTEVSNIDTVEANKNFLNRSATDDKLNNESDIPTNKRKHRDSHTEDSSYANYCSKYYRSNSKDSIYRPILNRSYEQMKYDDSNFKNNTNIVQRYPHYSFKYQGFKTNYRFYPHNYQFNNEYNHELLVNGSLETDVISDNDDLDDVLPNSESELFISSTNSSQNNNNKKISSKIINALDVDWSILSNKSVNINSARNNLDYLRPSYILSTIGVMKECLDDKTMEKIKDFSEKEDKLVDEIDDENYLKSLKNIKKQIENKCANNTLFKNSGNCLRNDIERRKALYFYQINKHFENNFIDNLQLLSSENINQNTGFIGDHFSFYQEAMELLKDDD